MSENYGSMPDELTVENCTVELGGVRALDNLTINIPTNSFVGIIGPNGAGKTTLVDAITGYVKPKSGRVVFRGTDISRMNVVKRARAGIRRTFQGGELFGDLNTLENLRVAAKNTSLPVHLLEELGIQERTNTEVDGLPPGIQRLVGVARALAGEPSLLLLDEPAAGLVGQEVDDFASWILQQKKERSMTVILVDHDMRLIRATCEIVMVLDFGSLVASGTLDEIGAHERVKMAYFGT
jgi:ABC-type branched-subunit amino acid transport system ATPase component